MSETAETALCPACSAPSLLEQVGSASGRLHYRCPKCGPWRAKNPAAAALGALGGQARAASMSPEARRQAAEDAANARWTAARLKKNGQKTP